MPVWVSEVGISTFGAEEVQVWGLDRTAELLKGKAPRVHWYSLYDLPQAWGATTRHKEAEGSSYYRHFYMGLIREDGTPKPSLEHFGAHTPDLGLCQWFHYEDHRLHDAVAWMKRLGVTYLRTGLSWADSFRPNALDWFDRQMDALGDFDVTVTFCFTPEHRGIAPHHTSAPVDPREFADFCAAMIDDTRAGSGSPRRWWRRSDAPGPRHRPDNGLGTGCGNATKTWTDFHRRRSRVAAAPPIDYRRHACPCDRMARSRGEQ